jgi:pyrimidine-nucleoside phosphorylase
MNTAEIIRKKRNGAELTKEEISYLILGYSRGEIPDYQLAAWAMAVYFQGMTPKETADLTIAIVASGNQVDLSQITGIKVDKHSTGGVGDKTTLVLAPLVAATGVKVAKLSGRGLGFTGGTIDKLESIPGFSIELSVHTFTQLVNQSGIAVMGQTAELTPADKQFYSLRDVTATVDSIPLIASSIMSKKIASGADAIVLDVKTGSGAFMKAEADSIRLAKAMVEIGNQVGRKTIAVISNMNQPLGFTIGNALEIEEAIETLRGHGPEDLTELSLSLGSHMLMLAGRASTTDEARSILQTCIQDGSAIQKCKEFISNQHGDASIVDNLAKLPQATQKITVSSPATGYIHEIQAEEIGLCAMLLGAGRAKKGDTIDHSVGIRLAKKVGDGVKAGETIATLYVNRTDNLDDVKNRFTQAITIREEHTTLPKLIHEIIG